jgi:hypothetical protein
MKKLTISVQGSLDPLREDSVNVLVLLLRRRRQQPVKVGIAYANQRGESLLGIAGRLSEELLDPVNEQLAPLLVYIFLGGHDRILFGLPKSTPIGAPIGLLFDLP